MSARGPDTFRGPRNAGNCAAWPQSRFASLLPARATGPAAAGTTAATSPARLSNDALRVPPPGNALNCGAGQRRGLRGFLPPCRARRAAGPPGGGSRGCNTSVSAEDLKFFSD
jgi:hypothetical protein